MTDLPRLTADVVELREDVDYLLVLLEHNLAGPILPEGAAPPTGAAATGRPRPGSAHVWHNLTAGEAARAWETLIGWVDWLLGRYSLDDTIPECWYRHAPMVDELDALRAGWSAAYLDPAAQPTEPGLWLDRLQRTLERLRAWDRYGCAAGTHHEEIGAHAISVDRDRHREEYIFADINGRRGRVAMQSASTET
ncbi:MAG TPA: hypothetical protein VHC43_13955 [Mycobacteriales bacterium]|nr:hypothetical protein [Mycobacteriales bacterium]